MSDANCFKVINSRNRSCSLDWDNEYSLSYFPNVEVFPKIGKIFVFDSWQKAKDFAGPYSSLQIWKAFGTNLTKVTGISDVLIMRYIKAFWNSGNTYVNLDLIPSGSLWCDSLTLIEKID